jgi:hypothetical protein
MGKEEEGTEIRLGRNNRSSQWASGAARPKERSVGNRGRKVGFRTNGIGLYQSNPPKYGMIPYEMWTLYTYVGSGL